jgi:hypothetical protein
MRSQRRIGAERVNEHPSLLEQVRVFVAKEMIYECGVAIGPGVPVEGIQAFNIEPDRVRIVGEGILTATIADYDASIKGGDGTERKRKLGDFALPLRPP